MHCHCLVMIVLALLRQYVETEERLLLQSTPYSLHVFTSSSIKTNYHHQLPLSAYNCINYSQVVFPWSFQESVCSFNQQHTTYIFLILFIISSANLINCHCLRAPACQSSVGLCAHGAPNRAPTAAINTTQPVTTASSFKNNSTAIYNKTQCAKSGNAVAAASSSSSSGR